MGHCYRLEDNFVKLEKKKNQADIQNFSTALEFFKMSHGFKSMALNTQPKIDKKLNLKVFVNGTTWLFRKYRNTLKSVIRIPFPAEITTI